MRAHLDDIVPGVRSGGREVRDDDLIDGVAVDPCRPRDRPRQSFERWLRLQPDVQRRVPRHERRVARDQTQRDRVRARPAQAHDADAAAPGRRRDRDDGVAGGEHCSRQSAVDSRP